jgi:plastocyanin
MERTPNVSGGWVGPPGVLHFHFVHRFNHSGPPARQVQNRPTFLLGYAVPGDVLAAVQYATRSALEAGVPNEWELLLRAQPVRQQGAPADLAVQLGYNAAARSIDSEVTAVRRAGRFRALLALRWLTRDAGSGGHAAVAAVGGVARFHDALAITADFGRRWAGASAGARPHGRYAWGAGLHARIPATPHTLSVHATNVDATTVHAASRGGGELRWGFEFTVPLTLARYLGGPRGAPATSAGAAGAPPAAAPEPGLADPGAAADTVVRVALRNLAFEPSQIRIRAGTIVEWHNSDPLEHTVTAEDGSWDSGPIQPGETWRNRFARPGRYRVICTPHPFMRAEVIVE